MKGAQPSTSAAAGAAPGGEEGEENKRTINSELWHACAGPLVALPPPGTLVVYFPQGHSEQVAASMHKNGDGHVPNYPNLASKLICMLHNVTLHADPETDEVYAQMTLQPINTDNKEALLASSAYSPVLQNRPQTEFFCKTLTASDTSTHGGFSVPRRSAEKIFPPLDFSMQPPVQELKAKDLHDNVWTFRHIYRGQPKRHLLTTGWSLFVSGKRLVAGDSVLFVRDEKSQQLLLGIRRANKQPTSLPSSVLSSDSMHIGILAAAAHAAANSSPFTIFYNPRASPSEFVIPLAKYNKAIYSTHVSLGMRFRMTFETEESGTRRYMGTITAINDLDPVRWKNSQWRNLQVAWDESAAGEKRNRVSIWEIEPVIAPFFICPTPFFSTKHPRQLGTLDDETADMENLFKRVRPWLGEDISIRDSLSQNAVNPGLSLVQWMNMQRNPLLTSSSLQQEYLRSISGPNSQTINAADLSRKLGLQMQMMQQNTIQFNAQKPPLQAQQLDQASNISVPSIQVATTATQQQQLHEVSLQQRQHLLGLTNPINQTQNPQTQSQMPISIHVQQQQKQTPFDQTLNPLQTNNLQNQSPQLQFQHYQQAMQQQIQNKVQIQSSQQTDQHSQILGEQFQLHTVQPQPQPQPQLQQLQPQLQQPQPQKPQQQQQFILPQSMLRQPHQFEQQNTLPEASGNLSNINSLSQQNPSLQQVAKKNFIGTLFSQSWQQQTQQKNEHQYQQAKATDPPGVFVPKAQANLLSPNGGCSTTNGAAQSVITDDAPSCSTSPSTNNGNVFPQIITSKINCHLAPVDQVSHAAGGMVNPGSYSFRDQTTSPRMIRESQQYESQVKPSVTISKTKKLGIVASHTYPVSAAQIDYFDSISSVTSAHRSQNDGQLQSNFASSSFNESTMFIGDNTQGGELQASDLFGINMGGQLGMPIAKDSLLNKDTNPRKDNSNDLPTFNIATNYNTKEAQQEPSSSYVSQSFGAPDNAFNSIDTTINDNSLLNKCSWAPPPHLQRTRTYTKVYKRGAVGRSIDITRYSGYDELKQDLARMFSLGRQVEDLQRMGWKLVFVDHENDVLLVGDDPWEEFVNNVRCIKILSPQEVQQIDDLGNNSLPNQACSSSDEGNAWRAPVDQIVVNPSTLTYDHFG